MVYAVVVAWLVLAAIVVLTWGRLDTDRGWRGTVVALTLGLSLLHQLLFATVTDDALVSFRYAQNIADGNGPVFNPGERVEGYTNFLWLVLIALPRAAFGADVQTTAVVFGVVSALGCVLVSYFLVNRIVVMATPDGAEPRPAIGVAAAVLTASAGGLAVYGPSGSEVPLFVLLVLAVCYSLAARRPVVAGRARRLRRDDQPGGARRRLPGRVLAARRRAEEEAQLVGAGGVRARRAGVPDSPAGLARDVLPALPPRAAGREARRPARLAGRRRLALPVRVRLGAPGFPAARPGRGGRACCCAEARESRSRRGP